MISVTWVNASVLASRSGIIAHISDGDFPSASGSSGNGFFRRNSIVLSSGADNSSVAASRAWPNASRFPQRCTDATQSRARTRSPSCHFSPSRRVSLP